MVYTNRYINEEYNKIELIFSVITDVEVRKKQSIQIKISKEMPH